MGDFGSTPLESGFFFKTEDDCQVSTESPSSCITDKYYVDSFSPKFGAGFKFTTFTVFIKRDSRVALSLLAVGGPINTDISVTFFSSSEDFDFGSDSPNQVRKSGDKQWTITAEDSEVSK